MKKTILSFAAVLTALVFQDGKPAPVMPTVGEAAPTVRLNAHDGKAVHLKPNDEGRWTLLAFFPKAATPG